MAISYATMVYYFKYKGTKLESVPCVIVFYALCAIRGLLEVLKTSLSTTCIYPYTVSSAKRSGKH